MNAVVALEVGRVFLPISDFCCIDVTVDTVWHPSPHDIS